MTGIKYKVLNDYQEGYPKCYILNRIIVRALIKIVSTLTVAKSKIVGNSDL